MAGNFNTGKVDSCIDAIKGICQQHNMVFVAVLDESHHMGFLCSENMTISKGIDLLTVQSKLAEALDKMEESNGEAKDGEGI